MGWNFRLAEAKDAEDFSRWTLTNPQIDPRDLQASLKANNPTVLYFVAEHDGVAIAFAPVFLSAVLAHLSFNPEARAGEKMIALNVLKDGVAAMMVQYGIREVLTMSKPEYGVAKWAVLHGFEQDPRNLFRLDLNQEMVEAH